MDNTFPSLISSANSILILLPDKPVFDQVAAALSLYLSLRGIKDASISSPNPITVEFNRLVGVDKITQGMGNKNLTIRFKNYPAENIERVSADVEGSEFKLTVIPKTGLTSPQKEQVELSSSGVASDLVILVGGNNDLDFSSLNIEDLSGAKIVHIGIKQLLASPNKAIMSFTLPVSSLSELAAILIKESNLNLNGDSATNLIAGIEEGTNNFTGEAVSADTFEVFAHLLRSGGQRPQKGGLKREYPKGSIPGQDLKVPVRKVTQSVAGGENVITEQPPEEQSINPAPKDWFEPKIYKGTSVS
ncbi:hypothetical protein COX03_03010 [Candidatus Woesebacteria bacterium CG22_combo_CG10-13_8_21_14_all_39_10]|uniref:Uncharacterized protein n=3 Tax=Candidatus Woeseibacteriota TaxID=1752722 RepID=A0A2H0BIF8_9BACT|nr:MAG: hypothetical protein COX03_03010 [Candidatus Woesebacteria bacterium CG22_combo_CG10-13_8_21_14_all_39_10]PIZ47639.1 MAG: hypothetical protein COY29_04950 [Candidatus Woesebacteria bacterium CG_4_10_14_0_2_um_filter_39_14]